MIDIALFMLVVLSLVGLVAAPIGMQMARRHQPIFVFCQWVASVVAYMIASWFFSGTEMRKAFDSVAATAYSLAGWLAIIGGFIVVIYAFARRFKRRKYYK